MRPRAALALAGDRDHAGRSGSDLLVAIVALVVATRLRALVAAVWLASAIDVTLGVRAVTRTLTDAVVVDLGFLVVGALAIWVAAGPRRELGRAFDLACVAVLPLVFVDVIASVVVEATQASLPRGAMWALSGIAYAWMGGLVALAIVDRRRRGAAVGDVRTPRRAGWALVLVALAGVAVQTAWVVRHADLLRPMQKGDAAPQFALPRIGPGGVLGDKVSLVPGKVTVVDFWATWCNPCLRAMPKLDALARAHPDVAVIAINIDDPVEARALFDERHYSMTLLAGDQLTLDRYGVGPIPHTVVIDRAATVRRVLRGGNVDLEGEVSALLK